MTVVLLIVTVIGALLAITADGELTIGVVEEIRFLSWSRTETYKLCPSGIEASVPYWSISFTVFWTFAPGSAAWTSLLNSILLTSAFAFIGSGYDLFSKSLRLLVMPMFKTSPGFRELVLESFHFKPMAPIFVVLLASKVIEVVTSVFWYQFAVKLVWLLESSPLIVIVKESS